MYLYSRYTSLIDIFSPTSVVDIPTHKKVKRPHFKLAHPHLHPQSPTSTHTDATRGCPQNIKYKNAATRSTRINSNTNVGIMQYNKRQEQKSKHRARIGAKTNRRAKLKDLVLCPQDRGAF